MQGAAFNLAIETSSRLGSVTLGRGDELLATLEMPPQERHRVDLMPTIDRLCREHAALPRSIGEVYISVGPGSFTGLRIGITTAKVLAMTLGAKVVAVPTLDVVAEGVEAGPRAAGRGPRNVESETTTPLNPQPSTLNPSHLAVALNMKGDSIYAGLYERSGERWKRTAEPALTTLTALLASAPRPLAIVGEPLPPHDWSSESNVTVLPATQAVGRSDALWRLGREKSRAGDFADALALLPLYVRPPEAEELWKRRHAEKS